MVNVGERAYVVDGIDHAAHSRKAEAARGSAAGLAAIEVVDIGVPDAVIAGELVKSFRRTGFAVVTGHGVPASLFDDLCSVSAAFFALPLEEKMQVGFPAPEIIRGYEPVPGDGDREVNLMESFLINRLSPVDDQPAGSLGSRLWRWPNLWPRRPAELQVVFERYYLAMERLGNRLLQAVALGLGLDEDTFVSGMDRHFSNLAANNYPAFGAGTRADRLRNRPHTDHGALTLLYRPAEPGGLEVFADDHWWTVPHVDGALVLNVGDVLDRWTNGLLPATPHRVINPAGATGVARTSFAYFQQPNPDQVISPITGLLGTTTAARYSDVVCGPHISIKEFGATRYQSFVDRSERT